MTNLIVVDHDNYNWNGYDRFNTIVPLLKTYGFLDKYIIAPDEVNDYLHSDNDVLYTLTARTPEGPAEGWLDALDEIPQDIIEKANSGVMRIAYFIGEIVAMKPRDLIVEINKRLKDAGINKKYITIYSPNFELDSELFQIYQHVQYIPIFEMSYRQYLTNYHGIPTADNYITEVNLNPRSKKYTCLNHIQKIHRKITGATLYNNGLLDDGYFSFHNTAPMVGAPELDNIVDTTEFDKGIPYILDTDDSEVVNFHWKVEKRFFNDAYWNFVTESFVADHSVVTEKTFKPIVNLQPFVLVAAPHALEAIRNSGYRTSRLVINESYDKIESHAERMQVVMDLMVTLAKKSDEEHIKMMTTLKPMLEHNQQLFFSKTWRDFI